MDIALTVLVLVVALAALAYPLYRVRTQPALVTGSTLDDLLAQRDGVYATLRDLELDRQLGKLDDADYRALHERYMVRATEILQEIDLLRGEGDAAQASDEIEQEVRALRKNTVDGGRKTVATPGPQTNDAGRSAKPKANPSKMLEPANPAEAPELFCPSCGRKHNPGDKFCARCGHALS